MNKRKMFIDFIMGDSFTFTSFNLFLKKSNLDATSALEMAYRDLNLLTRNILKIDEHKYFIHRLYYFSLLIIMFLILKEMLM